MGLYSPGKTSNSGKIYDDRSCCVGLHVCAKSTTAKEGETFCATNTLLFHKKRNSQNVSLD